MKKGLLALMIMMVVMIAACSSSEEGGSGSDNRPADSNTDLETTTIHFWKPPHGPDQELFSKLIASFEQENPGIEVIHTIVPWDSVDQQYATTFAGSEPPDVVFMPDEWFPRYANGGGLLDITDRFEEISGGWDESIAALGQYKGVQYGVPHIMATQAFLYNTDLFAAAGYSGPPQTLAELKDMAVNIADESAGIYGLEDKMIGFNVQFWGPLFEAEGVKLLNEDLSRATFNTPEAVMIVDYIKELYDAGATVPRNRFTGAQQDVQLFNGNIAMAYLNYDKVGTIVRENPELNFEVSLPPATPSGRISQAAFYGFMFVSEKSEYKDEAWEFVKYVTNAENLEYYAQNVSMFSTRNDSTWWEDEEMAIPFAEAIHNAPGVIPTVHWRELCRIIGEEIDYVIADQKTSAQALDDAEAAINEILDGN